MYLCDYFVLCTDPNFEYLTSGAPYNRYAIDVKDIASTQKEVLHNSNILFKIFLFIILVLDFNSL